MTQTLLGGLRNASLSGLITNVIQKFAPGHEMVTKKDVERVRRGVGVQVDEGDLV